MIPRLIVCTPALVQTGLGAPPSYLDLRFQTYEPVTREGVRRLTGTSPLAARGEIVRALSDHLRPAPGGVADARGVKLLRREIRG